MSGLEYRASNIIAIDSRSSSCRKDRSAVASDESDEIVSTRKKYCSTNKVAPHGIMIEITSVCCNF